MTSKCPGTSSQNAGYEEACKGCPNANFCKEEKQIDPDIELISNNMKSVKQTVAVMSGKGGVGKSTFTTNLAIRMAKTHKTLILDFDLAGPSIPRLTKTQNNIIFESNNILYPIEIDNNLFCISVGHFIKEDINFMDSNIKTNIIKKILKYTAFDQFDYVFIDTPPGVSDEHLGLINYMKINCCILISTPQSIAFNDVKRQIDFCNKTKLNIIGIVENMKNYVCLECGHENYIFKDSGIKKFCDTNNYEYLGSIQLKQEYAKNSDYGQAIDDPIFDQICKKLNDRFLGKI